MVYVVGIGNLPDSDELAGYYYLTNPTGYGLQAFRTKKGAEAYIEVTQQPQVTYGTAGKQRVKR